MYAVYRNNRKLSNTFQTYELARQYARKRIRKATPGRKAGQPVTTGGFSLDLFGFKIVKV